MSAPAVAARGVVRVSLAEIDRRLGSITTHHIRRLDRFLGNSRILISEAVKSLWRKLRDEDYRKNDSLRQKKSPPASLARPVFCSTSGFPELGMSQ